MSRGVGSPPESPGSPPLPHARATWRTRRSHFHAPNSPPIHVRNTASTPHKVTQNCDRLRAHAAHASQPTARLNRRLPTPHEGAQLDRQHGDRHRGGWSGRVIAAKLFEVAVVPPDGQQLSSLLLESGSPAPHTAGASPAARRRRRTALPSAIARCQGPVRAHTHAQRVHIPYCVLGPVEGDNVCGSDIKRGESSCVRTSCCCVVDCREPAACGPPPLGYCSACLVG